MKSISRQISVLLLSFFPLWGMAVTQISIPSIISFEDDEDLTDWVFNEGSESAVDKWIVGGATHIDGKKSLYITCTPDSAAQFSNHPNVSVAYRILRFPEATEKKHYDISFDYRCVGHTTGGKLYVALFRETDFKNFMLNVPNSADGYIADAYIQQFEKLGPNSLTFLNNQPEWTNISFNVDVGSVNSKKDYYLLFVWQNLITDSTQTGTGACVDNIQFSNSEVKKPENVTVEAVCEDSALLISWESALTTFAVEYRKSNSQTWRRFDHITEGTEGYTEKGNRQSFQINQLPEATYDVRVRGVSYSGEDTSAYVVFNRYLLYCPENHCVDYMNLRGPNVTCYYGHTSEDGAAIKGSPYEVQDVFDYGPDAAESRHTVHTDPDEMDPRTDYRLHTVPTGALGAVRLGNWNAGCEAEAIQYKLTVDSANQGILIMKYAVVLNKPKPNCGDPGFKLEVKDASDNLISTCGSADFSYSKAKASGWLETDDGNVVFKDWTTVGIDLTSYNNQTLTIEVLTYDCGGGAHFGYAYFTMDCANATIETENCGDDAMITAEAPEGFDYTWMNESGDVVGNERTLSVPPGDHMYTCRVTYIEQPDCYFDLTTAAAPRFPTPEFTPQWQPKNCYNYVKLQNTSHVRTMYEGKVVHTSEGCNDYDWIIRSLTGKGSETPYEGTISPTYNARPEGDTLEVELTAYLGEDRACDETLKDTIIIPSIISRDSVIRKELCEGDAFQFAGEYRTVDSVYVDVQDNFAGCDSITTLYLTVHPNTPDIHLIDTTCSDKRYTFNGQYCDTAGHYMAHLRNHWGCDSIVYLNLTIMDNLQLDYDTASFVCADDKWMNLRFYVIKGEFDSVAVHFSQSAKQVGFKDMVFFSSDLNGVLTCPYPENVKPGNYSLDMEYFQHKSCGSHVYHHNFVIRYASSIIKQKWNDALGIYNASKNGGYSFVAYQWYMNGQPIPGATEPFYYGQLDMNAKYSVLLTRQDGEQVMSCDMQPTTHTDVRSFPTIVKASQMISVKQENAEQVTIYTIGGLLVYSTHSVSAFDSVEMPSIPGVYIVQMMFNDGTQKNSQLIVTQ